MKPKTICIVGLGLMGGSLAAACRKKYPKSRIIAVTRNKTSLRYARRRRWIHQGTSNLSEGVRQADLIILCTPVHTLKRLLNKIDQSVREEVRVTDVGSVKGPLCSWAEKRRFKHVRFVGAHPMVGSHLRGAKAAYGDLYDHGYTFVIPSKRAGRKANAAMKAFWKRMSPRVYEVTAKNHDEIVSKISHLPHIAAVCLVLGVGKKALPFGSSGFRDTTRIAKGHPSIWVPILKENKGHVIKALGEYEKTLKKIKRAVRQRSDNFLTKMLREAAR